MRPPETEARTAASARSEQGAADPFSESGAPQVGPSMNELLGVAGETTRGILEAEDSLRVLRERYDRTEEPAEQGELAVEALDQVERQLSLTRGRRQQLDSIEGKLWSRRNRLERLLINARGRTWWRERRKSAANGDAPT
jgi:hypothetical protein